MEETQERKLIRKGIVSIPEVLDHVIFKDIPHQEPAACREYMGEQVKMTSHRYRCFKIKGLKCVTCGIEGKYFALERHTSSRRFHFNLYALDKDGKEVLMTKDHIVPQSKGGPNWLGNYQTMCHPCNRKKGDKLDAAE